MKEESWVVFAVPLSVPAVGAGFVIPLRSESSSAWGRLVSVI